MAPAMLTVGFFLSLGFLQKFDLTHLWFLHQLLVIYFLALGLRFAVKRLPGAGSSTDHGSSDLGGCGPLDDKPETPQPGGRPAGPTDRH